MDEHLTPEFSNRLIARTIANMGTLFQNIKTFQRVARRVIGGARASEQIGTMLAGLYLLHSEKPVEEAFAENWVKKYNWNDHTIVDEDTDPVRLVQHLSSSIVRYQSSLQGSSDKPIGEIIMEADKGNWEDKALRMNGIAVIGQTVYVATRSQNLSRLLRGTDWELRWSTTLMNIEGAQKHSVIYFAAGVKTSAVSIPLSLFAKDKEQVKMDFRKPEAEEIPFD